MTPPNWRGKTDSGGADPKRTVVLETAGGVTEVAFCPADVAISHYDYDDAGAEGRLGSEETECHADVERARERAATIVDEQAAIEVLCDVWELADRSDNDELRDRIDEVLAPVTAFFSGGDEVSFEEYRRRSETEEAGEE